MASSGSVITKRMGTLGFGFIATLGWALSFWLLRRGMLCWSMAAIEAAAVLSWPVLGLVMVRRTRAHLGARTLGVCFDLCLATLTRGSAILGIGALINVGLWLTQASVSDAALIATHVMVLTASGLVMSVEFVRRTAALGIPKRSALGFWGFGLLTPFACILAAAFVVLWARGAEGVA